MPIISFNVSDNLKKFLKKMVGQKQYKNNSYVMRDALIRLMQEKDGGTSAANGSESSFLSDSALIIPKITSSVLITIKSSDIKLERKLSRMEISYHQSILNKSIFTYQDRKSITYILEDTMDMIQQFITELNSLEELQSFRYIINEPEVEEELEEE